MNVTLIHYSGLEFQGGSNSNFFFAQRAEGEKKGRSQTPENNIKKTRNPKEKWPKAMNKAFTEEESEEPGNNRKRFNSISNQRNGK